MDAFATRDLLSFLASVPDPRSRHGRQHPLSAILALVCCAFCAAQELRGNRSMGAGSRHHADAPTRLHPSASEDGRDPQGPDRLNVRAFEHALTEWVGTLLSRPITATRHCRRPTPGWQVGRGSFDGLQKAVHLLSLLAHESGLTLAQMAVPNGGEEKTNEHKAALRLLEGLVWKGVGDW